MNDPLTLLGKVVMVGLTWVNRAGTVTRQSQFHGRILSADRDGEEPFRLPPAFDALQPAPPGTYREHGSGIAVEDPDFLTMWQILEASEPNQESAWRPGPSLKLPS
jgi:hypothetical protein